MYEVHPNLADQWVLYDTGDGNCNVIAWFPGREDAEFAREAFEKSRNKLKFDLASSRRGRNVYLG